jgi:hypothetical protein
MAHFGYAATDYLAPAHGEFVNLHKNGEVREVF